jgi:hypothetical protein
MMKQQRIDDKLNASLVAPFILRNAKALFYIMIHLNGIDCVLDHFLLSNENIKPNFKVNSIMCIHRILLFLNYKRDMKQIGDFYEEKKDKVSNLVVNQVDADDLFYINNSFEFVFVDEEEASTFADIDEFGAEFPLFPNQKLKKITAKKSLLSKQSDYFHNLLVNENFASADNTTEVRNTRYETFNLILSLLNCVHVTVVNRQTIIESTRLTFDSLIELILACDQYMLNDLKDFFVAVLVNEFLSTQTLSVCFKLAWYVNSQFLASAVVDLLLSELGSNETILEKESALDAILFDLKQTSNGLIVNRSQIFLMNENNERLLMEYFRRVMRTALSEIIKNNTWKF